MDCKVIIIGLGIGGYAMAFRLVEIGKRVLLAEKGTALRVDDLCIGEKP